MNAQALVAFSEKLHDIVGKNPDLFGSEVDSFRKDNAIDEPASLKQAFVELQEESRLLNIGIVGRVKAGKSSLLNALVFQGESILPKAATPMTAALTTLTWGEAFQVEVEFFSESDVALITEKARSYRTKFEAKQAEILTELSSMKARFNNAVSGAKEGISSTNKASAKPRLSPEEMASKRAIGFMQEQYADLCAAFDQDERMKQSGVQWGSLKNEGRITAANPQELASKLQNYVGATGKFMPFAKAVHIFMPLEDLRDVRVIDTPGMNDPVQSREARTVELLKTCDVVFIVSPAGQFLSEQDLEVMGRITTKEGIQKIVLVASQVDTQLYGSEKRARLDDALGSIRSHLATRAVQALSGLKRQSPEIGSVFDSLIAEPENNLLHSAGICHSLKTRHSQRQTWDANEKQTWQNLCTHYPDYFSDTDADLALACLDKLSNMAAIHGMLHDVRAQKDALQASKLDVLWNQKQTGLKRFREQLIAAAENRITLIQNSDVQQLKAQQEQLKKNAAKLSRKLDNMYAEWCCIYERKLSERLEEKQAEIFSESKKEMEGAEDTYTEQRRREKSGVASWFARELWGGGYESYTETGMRIVTAPVYSALQNFLRKIKDKLSQVDRDARPEFNTALSQTLTQVLNDILGDDFDIPMLVKKIREVIDGIPTSEFSLGVSIPSELKIQGTLKSYEAERYKDKANDFLYDLRIKSEQSISSHIKNMRTKFPENISTHFVRSLEDEISRLTEQIENSAQTIDRLNRVARTIKEVEI